MLFNVYIFARVLLNIEIQYYKAPHKHTHTHTCTVCFLCRDVCAVSSLRNSFRALNEIEEGVECEAAGVAAERTHVKQTLKALEAVAAVDASEANVIAEGAALACRNLLNFLATTPNELRSISSRDVGGISGIGAETGAESEAEAETGAGSKGGSGSGDGSLGVKEKISVDELSIVATLSADERTQGKFVEKIQARMSQERSERAEKLSELRELQLELSLMQDKLKNVEEQDRRFRESFGPFLQQLESQVSNFG